MGSRLEPGRLGFKILGGMTKRGAVIRGLMAIRGGRSFLPSWRTFWENLCRVPALITIISRVCTVWARMCGFALCWQAVVSQRACLCKCAFVLWVFKQLSRCLLVFHLPDMAECLFKPARTPRHPNPPPYCLPFIFNQAASVTAGWAQSGCLVGWLSCQRWGLA